MQLSHLELNTSKESIRYTISLYTENKIGGLSLTLVVFDWTKDKVSAVCIEKARKA